MIVHQQRQARSVAGFVKWYRKTRVGSFAEICGAARLLSRVSDIELPESQSEKAKEKTRPSPREGACSEN